MSVEALKGKALWKKMKTKKPPDIMLVEVNMPIMAGVETVTWLHNQYPSMHLVALSMNDADKRFVPPNSQTEKL
ncbi:MAG: response regulator [Chitinophagaceae bacterium]